MTIVARALVLSLLAIAPLGSALAAPTGKVIIELRTEVLPEGRVAALADLVRQRAHIAADQRSVINHLAASERSSTKRFKYLPLVAAKIGARSRAALLADPAVVGIHEDRMLHTMLDDSTPLVGGTELARDGFGGAGQVVAVLDTGVDSQHPFLRNKVVHQACFSTSSNFDGTRSLCPNGSRSQVNAPAGEECPARLGGCSHGTHVAGIAAGSGSGFTGVAPDADIMAVQVFSELDGSVVAFTSDIIAALEHVYEQRNRFSIAAVNMSLGGGFSSGSCDNEPSKRAIDLLRSVNIAVVVASGNEGFSNGIASPACVSSAISVGATSKSDVVTNFSNSAQVLDLLAPGAAINSSVPGSAFDSFNGTSMATPHVAGAFAALRSARPAATEDAILAALVDGGIPVRDTRNSLVRPRIDLVEALRLLGGSGAGSALSLTPTDDLSASGTVGGPFAPAIQDYVLRNTGASSVTYRVSDTADWLSVSPDSGTLAAGAEVRLRVSLTTGTASLIPGNYSARVRVEDRDGGRTAATRNVLLEVQPEALANDKFDDATELRDLEGSTTANTTLATREPGEPNHGGPDDRIGHSLWWHWTAPEAGAMTVDTVGSDFDTVLGVYTGTSLNNITLVANNDDLGAGGLQSRVDFDVEQGVTYYFAVDGYDDASGNARLNWLLEPTQRSRDTISVTPLEGVEFSGAAGGPFAPREAAFEVINVSTANIALRVTNAPAWVAVAPAEATLAPDQSVTVRFAPNASAASLAPGAYAKTARFEADGEVAQTRSLRLTVLGAGGGDNDDFARARQLTGDDVTDTADNSDASVEPGEPPHANIDGGRSLWWRWRAPRTAQYTVTTDGSDFDTILGMYTGSRVDALSAVAGDDDGGEGLRSLVTIAAAAGTEYFIAVDGYFGASGAVRLSIGRDLAAGVPSNDDFANAARIVGEVAIATGNNENATLETGEPEHGGVGGGRSVWWAWRSPTSGIASVDTFDSAFDTTLSVYAGNALSSLDELASNDDFSGLQAAAVFSALAGQTYYIAVDGYQGASGAIGLRVVAPEVPAPPNDDFADALELDGLSDRTMGSNMGAGPQSGEPGHGGSPASRSIWWRWRAPAGGVTRVYAPGSPTAVRLGVYTGANVGALSDVPALHSSSAGSVRFDAREGQIYYIAVDSVNGATGDVSVAVLHSRVAAALMGIVDMLADE